MKRFLMNKFNIQYKVINSKQLQGTIIKTAPKALFSNNTDNFTLYSNYYNKKTNGFYFMLAKCLP